MEYKNQKTKYQLNILIDTENELEFEYIFNYYSKFTKKDIGDSGIDLITPDDQVILGKSFANTLNYKIKCSMINIETGEFVSYYLYTRSSISSTPLRLANHVGIIDAGYRGNIMAKFDNTSSEVYHVPKGSRLCQICGPDLAPIIINLTHSLNKTSRGQGGFGSTG